ncbi:MAG: hypothetical protein IJS54_00940 [Desulfovibrio sp.]|nr:hypothetical protein [Desulfovibrio sp.]
MEETMKVALERKVVEVFEARRLEKKMTIDDLARRLYPNLPIANARMNVNRLRKPQVNGKPKRLLFGDFVDICLALDLIPERVIAQTVGSIENS